MSAARLSVASVAAAALCIAACKSDDGYPQNAGMPDATALDAGRDTGRFGDQPPWDPVWHETAKKDWQAFGPDGQPDCGPGCRMALNAKTTTVLYYGFTYTTQLVLNDGMGPAPAGLMLAPVGSATTYRVGPAITNTGAPIQPYLWDRRVSYLYTLGPYRGRVEVMDIDTGETKVAFTFDKSTVGNGLGVALTGLNASNVFWEMDGIGIMARDLATGEIKLLAPGPYGCFGFCVTDDAVICQDNGGIFYIDQNGGGARALDYDGAVQADGVCSPSRGRFVWVDYRDPPGRQSTFDSTRSGGEIYMRDLATHTTTRLTFDSPGNPTAKTRPGIGDGDVVVWDEAPAGPNQNPADVQDIYASTSLLVKLDLRTGERCRAVNPYDGNGFMGFKTVYGNHLYGYWYDAVGSAERLADLDLDAPSLHWQCEPTPGWPDGGVP